MTLPQSCATCGKSLEDRQPPTCPRCKTLYCDSDCQRADWKAQTARVRQELDAVRAARKGDAVDGSKLERGPIVLDKTDDGDEKTIDSID